MPSKPPSDPVHRPEPAVGQVWKCGRTQFLIVRVYHVGSEQYGVVNHRGEVAVMGGLNECVIQDDTYVGQFRGFKVEEME